MMTEEAITAKCGICGEAHDPFVMMNGMFIQHKCRLTKLTMSDDGFHNWIMISKSKRIYHCKSCHVEFLHPRKIESMCKQSEAKEIYHPKKHDIEFLRIRPRKWMCPFCDEIEETDQMPSTKGCEPIVQGYYWEHEGKGRAECGFEHIEFDSTDRKMNIQKAVLMLRGRLDPVYKGKKRTCMDISRFLNLWVLFYLLPDDKSEFQFWAGTVDIQADQESLLKDEGFVKKFMALEE